MAHKNLAETGEEGKKANNCGSKRRITRKMKRRIRKKTERRRGRRRKKTQKKQEDDKRNNTSILQPQTGMKHRVNDVSSATSIAEIPQLFF